MGSTGGGSFSDYSGQSNQSKGGGASGGSSGDDQCRQAFGTSLEDIQEYDRFSRSNTVPAVGAILTLRLDGRVVAADSNGETVGALPTKYNYLASCLKAGFKYAGTVTASSVSPVPNVVADFAPV